MSLSTEGLRYRHRRVMRGLRWFFGVQICFSVGVALVLELQGRRSPHWLALASGALVGLLLLPRARRWLRWLYIPTLLGMDIVHVTALLWVAPLEHLARGSLWALAYIPVLVAAGRWWSYAGGVSALAVVLVADAAVLFGRLPWRAALPVFVFQAVTALLGAWASAQGEVRARAYLAHAEALAVSEHRVEQTLQAHRTLASHLMSVGAVLMQADVALPGDPMHAQQRIDAAMRTTHTALGTIRRVLRNVPSTSLTDRTLPEVLAHEIDLLRRDLQLDSAFHYDGHLPPLRPAVAEYLLRAAQEALANVRDHAQARRVEVELHGDREHVVLAVRDDGVGFDVANMLAHEAHGWGLPKLRDQATQLGGDLVVRSQPDAGTTLTVRLPVARN